MAPNYLNNMYADWGWFLWFGMIILFALSIGNWGYSYQAHLKYSDLFPKKGAIDILNERYARGEINHEEYARMKASINADNNGASKRVA